ncbi:hypothetical protein BU16DRAFT_583242 [Lophium mytilinum]|uniref:SAM domain-containing protein n=1 Tax=Lophium mytilinum TaxID=390894 RepID=A0A6A6QQL8_9PEZI|nr:hypothetical protein BU16DRAFT_583242 [Lophium mytilinum]
MALTGSLGDQGSPVMNETLSVIDEHITDMNTPRHSLVAKDLRSGNDSGSEYSSHHRLSYINGHETDEEEDQNLHTEADVNSWTPARVAEYLEDVGVDKKHCEIFHKEEISGELLLAMDQATVFLKEFDLGPVGSRLRTWLKIKSLQQEVKAAREGPRSVSEFADESPNELPRNRSTSMGAILPRIPNLMDGSGSRTPPKSRQTLPRANSSMGHAATIMEATSPLTNVTPSSPGPGTPTRPSAASVRNMNQNRRHSSIDHANQATPGPVASARSPVQTSHKKTPSFDRGWTMGTPTARNSNHEIKRPSSSAHMHSISTEGAAFDNPQNQNGFTTASPADLDRGYFSGGEVDNRKARNVLRKRDSPVHSRNPSYSTESGRRSAYNRRHSRIGSTESMVEVTSPVSPAARAYYGAGAKAHGHRSSGGFDFVRPLKPGSDLPPPVTKLEYGKSPSIDAIAASPHLPSSEASSFGRASPSPATPTEPKASHSFFGKKSRTAGLRAISDAITGSEKAMFSSNSANSSSPIKESPLHSPTRTGSTTPSGTSKSFDLEPADTGKQSTGSSAGVSLAPANKRRKSKKQTSAYLRGRQQITPQDAMVGCDYSGWMKKKSSNLMTTWKPRLFVLRGRRLSYFYSEYDTEEKGLIDISSHRVLPANNERIASLHATLTRATSSPSSPQNPTIPTTASTDAASANAIEGDIAGMFIFKLVPPRSGLQKGVQFTKPIVHYFAVDNIQQGRLWMAALMKATIDRDENATITSTYQQKTISLEKARAMRQRPPALMGDDDDMLEADDDGASKPSKEESLVDEVIPEEDEKKGLAISGLDDAKALLEYAEHGDTVSSPVDVNTAADTPLPEEKRVATV